MGDTKYYATLSCLSCPGNYPNHILTAATTWRVGAMPYSMSVCIPTEILLPCAAGDFDRSNTGSLNWRLVFRGAGKKCYVSSQLLRILVNDKGVSPRCMWFSLNRATTFRVGAGHPKCLFFLPPFNADQTLSRLS